MVQAIACRGGVGEFEAALMTSELPAPCPMLAPVATESAPMNV